MGMFYSHGFDSDASAQPPEPVEGRGFAAARLPFFAVIALSP
jgi:hypothetical protein